jgi:hypothetical protein
MALTRRFHLARASKGNLMKNNQAYRLENIVGAIPHQKVRNGSEQDNLSRVCGGKSAADGEKVAIGS